jgi:DNA helicase HerA-like ATPase
MLLGKISGKVDTRSFNFEAEAKIKKLQYLAVKDPEGHWMLSYVDSITRYADQTVGRAEVIGYRDERGFLKSPSSPFAPETPVFAADTDLIKKTLGLAEKGLYFGLLEGYKIKVNLPVKHLTTKHIAILAKTGTGKSYAAGVLLEELAENNIPVVVIDPHGEYSTLMEENTKKDELRFMDRFEVEPKSYKKQVQVFGVKTGKQLKLNSKLTANDIFEMMPAKLSSAQKGILYSAIKSLQGREYSLKDIIDEVNEKNSQAKWNLLSLLGFLEDTKLFSANPIKPQELVREGRITIIDLKDAQPEIQQIVVLNLCKDLFEARKAGKIPQFLLVLEEAHNFCPERGFGEVASSKMIRTLASEGRKFGLGLCIISQRPAKVDKNILSQCSTQIILKVTNPNDLRAITDSVEGVMVGTKEDIKDLPIGVGLVVGVTDQPLLVNIRIRKSEHGGEVVKTGERKIDVIETKISLFAPKYFEKDVQREYKGIENIKFLNYPIWKVKCRYKNTDVNFYVDGLSGELVFKKDSEIEHTSGIRDLLELSPSQRAVIIHLTNNKIATADKIAKDLKMALNIVQTSLKELVEKNHVSTDGYVYRNNFNFGNFPQDPSQVQIDDNVVKKDVEGEILDFMISSQFVEKISEIWGMKVIGTEPVYYPYWIATHKNTKILIDGLTNKLEWDRSKFIRKFIE